MVDLRQILAQGRKRIGLLIGAGAPLSIEVGSKPLIPGIKELTADVIAKLSKENKAIIDVIKNDLEPDPNIETILTKTRSLSDVIGSLKYGEYTSADLKSLSTDICVKIGDIAAVKLPNDSTPYNELATWIGGTSRDHAVELFTTNYDLLFEESFEFSRIPYFDGFSGSREAFFDPSSIIDDSLPSRWARLWKLHGSLGWKISDRDVLTRDGSYTSTELIFPEHRKYDKTQKMPYVAFFDRLRKFLLTPDTLLLSCGFSYFDDHVTSVIDEALASNPSSSLFAFQYNKLTDEQYVREIAIRRSNISVFAHDGGIFNCISGQWQLGKPPNNEWERIRRTYWGTNADSDDGFLLGSFQYFTEFFAFTRATNKIDTDESLEDPDEKVVATAEKK